MTNERACATRGELPDFGKLYDQAVQIRELFESISVLGDQGQDAFAIGTLTTTGGKLADEIVQAVKGTIA